MLQVVVRLIGHSTIGRSTPAGNGVL
jgi:hypothetical protein